MRRTEGLERRDRRQDLQVRGRDQRPIRVARVELAPAVALDHERGHARAAQAGRGQRGVEPRREPVGAARAGAGERASENDEHAADLRLLRRHVEPDELREGGRLTRAAYPGACRRAIERRAIGAMGGAVLNWIWLGLILLAVVYGAFTGRMQEVSAASFEGAKSAVTLVIGLTGFMVFMLGLDARRDRRRADARRRARHRAAMRRLFPDVPAEHPAMARDGDELRQQRARPRQRRDTVRPQGDARARDAESPSGRGERRDGAVPRDQRHARSRCSRRPARWRCAPPRARPRPRRSGCRR